MTDSPPPSRLEQILSQTVFTGGANVASAS
jgi:hypothetical protein